MFFGPVVPTIFHCSWLTEIMTISDIFWTFDVNMGTVILSLYFNPRQAMKRSP